MGLTTMFGLTNPALFAGFISRVVPGMSDALDEAGQEIIDLATSEVQSRLFPGHGYDTGALHDSYHGTATKSGMSVENIEFGSDLYYAPMVEFSWNGRVSHFFPAMQVVEQEIPNIMKKHINGALGI